MHYTLRKKETGFTLLELMATVTIIGILAAVGLPALGDLLKNNRMATQANSVILSLHYARNESVNRGINVRVEPLIAGTNWSAGWRVRIDGNDDGDFTDAEDMIIRNFEEVNSSNLTSSANNYVYSPNGQVATSGTLTLRANDCTGEHQRIINVKPSGFIWLDPNNQTCP